MMIRDMPAAPPGIHSYEEHWHQPAKTMPQGWWPQPGPYHANGIVANPQIPGYNQQMFYPDPAAFNHYQANMRSNSYPISPDAFNHANQRNNSQGGHVGYFNGAPQHPHTFMNPHYIHGHEHTMMPMQMPAFVQQPQQPYNGTKTAPNNGPYLMAGMQQWPANAALKPPMLHMNLVNGRPKVISPTRMSNGQISPISLSHGGVMQRADSVVEMSAPRGPPRKARQSGYALWVGNLPFSACIIALKDHFSRDAWNDIESLCLLSSSSCAFVNYRSEEAVLAAHQRFNGSRFGPVRLLCRVRNGKEQKISSRGSPIAAPPGLQLAESAGGAVQEIADDLAEMTIAPESGSVKDAASPVQTLSVPQKSGDRYFIVKSLTLQDLQVSLKNGLWETQPHNRIILDEAFDSAENVYLVFSVNKSGEYFGYARMASRSFEQQQQDDTTFNSNNNNNNPAESHAKFEAEVESPHHNAGLIIVPTAPTDTAPAGHIVEDIVRGTIFWEADIESQNSSSSSSSAGGGAVDSPLRQSITITDSTTTDDSLNDNPKSPTDSAKGLNSSSSSHYSHPHEEKFSPPPPPPPSSSISTSSTTTISSTSPHRRFRIDWRSFQCVPFRRTKGMRNSWNDNKEVKVARDGTELETGVGRMLVGLFHGGNSGNGNGNGNAGNAGNAGGAVSASASVGGGGGPPAVMVMGGGRVPPPPPTTTTTPVVVVVGEGMMGRRSVSS
jgi:hypothetical protein